MSVASASLDSHKGANILQSLNEMIWGNKNPKKLEYDFDDLYKPLNVEKREIRLLHIKSSLIL